MLAHSPPEVDVKQSLIQVRSTAFIAAALTILECAGCKLLTSPEYDEETGTYKVPVSEKDGGSFEHPDGFMPLSNYYTVHIGHAVAMGEVTVGVPYPAGSDRLGLDHMLISHGDESGDWWLRRVAEIGTRNNRLVSESIAGQLNSKESEEPRTFTIIYIPPLRLIQPTSILEVPYYWQGTTPWCSPTSLAMVLNYHDGGIGAIVSNWYLAGNHHQDRSDGAWGNGLMRSSGASEDFFDYLKWDADLIRDNPFTRRQHMAARPIRRFLGLS